MLFGEHGVVYNRSCLVTSVSSRIYVEVKKTKGRFRIDAPQVKDVRFVEESIRVFRDKYKIDNGLSIKTRSDFSTQYGFGSSSAVTVATLYALSKIYKIKLSLKEIFNLGYKVALDVQGVGSGFDIAAATYGGVLYFFTGGKIIKSLKTGELPLIVGYSGNKADTPSIVKKLKHKMQNSKEKLRVMNIFNSISEIVEKAKEEIEKNNLPNLGNLMNDNHSLLQQLGVSTKKLDEMCQLAVQAGAWGAKLSGAGGGDCMIALVSDKKKNRVIKAIERSGGQVILVNNNQLGVCLEK